MKSLATRISPGGREQDSVFFSGNGSGYWDHVHWDLWDEYGDRDTVAYLIQKPDYGVFVVAENMKDVTIKRF